MKEIEQKEVGMKPVSVLTSKSSQITAVLFVDNADLIAEEEDAEKEM